MAIFKHTLNCFIAMLLLSLSRMYYNCIVIATYSTLFDITVYIFLIWITPPIYTFIETNNNTSTACVGIVQWFLFTFLFVRNLVGTDCSSLFRKSIATSRQKKCILLYFEKLISIYFLLRYFYLPDINHMFIKLNYSCTLPLLSW